jgi:hypothetical protein
MKQGNGEAPKGKDEGNCVKEAMFDRKMEESLVSFSFGMFSYVGGGL